MGDPVIIAFCIPMDLCIFVQAADLNKPIDKRVYKGTCPTCHDFNTFTAREDSVMVLIGFTAGQIQLIDPIKKEISKLYNEEVTHLQFYYYSVNKESKWLC